LVVLLALALTWLLLLLASLRWWRLGMLLLLLWWRRRRRQSVLLPLGPLCLCPALCLLRSSPL
jgi:hypothetical protein